MANVRQKSEGRSVVAERLKTFRLERNLTLAELSQRSGVSVSNLSKIERGEVSPSFDVIFRVCEGLDVVLEQFVKPGPKEGIFGRKTFTRNGTGIPFSSGQYDYVAHSTELSRKAMVPLEMWVRARSVDEFDHWSQHDGEEYVYVISGAIAVHTDHYAPFQLGAGESAYFDSGMRHIYVSLGSDDAHVLSVSHGPTTASTSVTSFMQPEAKQTSSSNNRPVAASKAATPASPNRKSRQRPRRSA
jgi:transcriptional regulator with XRE-family HTH domain